MFWPWRRLPRSRGEAGLDQRVFTAVLPPVHRTLTQLQCAWAIPGEMDMGWPGKPWLFSVNGGAGYPRASTDLKEPNVSTGITLWKGSFVNVCWTPLSAADCFGSQAWYSYDSDYCTHNCQMHSRNDLRKGCSLSVRSIWWEGHVSYGWALTWPGVLGAPVYSWCSSVLPIGVTVLSDWLSLDV